MSVKLKYVGDRDEVTIAATFETVKRRETFEVPRDIADELVKSGEFKRVETHRSGPKAKPSAKADDTPEPAAVSPDDAGAEPEESN